MTPAATPLQHSAYLAGLAAAHVLDTIIHQGGFTPIMFVREADGTIAGHRLAADGSDLPNMRDNVLRASTGAIAAGFVYDGYVTLPHGRFDAMLIEILDPTATEPVMFRSAVPYVPKHGLKRFVMHRPKVLLTPPGWEEEQLWQVLDHFWHAIDKDPAVARKWDHFTDDNL